MEQAKKTAAFRVVTDSGGSRVFRFYCDISGELCCVTKPVQADTEEAALEIAWEQEGKWEDLNAWARNAQCLSTAA